MIATLIRAIDDWKNYPDAIWNCSLKLTFQCLLTIPVLAFVPSDIEKLVKAVLSVFSVSVRAHETSSDRVEKDRGEEAAEKTSELNTYSLSDEVLSMGLELLLVFMKGRPAIPAVCSLLSRRYLRANRTWIDLNYKAFVDSSQDLSTMQPRPDHHGIHGHRATRPVSHSLSITFSRC